MKKLSEYVVVGKNPVMIIAGMKAGVKRRANLEKSMRKRAAIIAHGTIKANKLKKMFGLED